MDENKTLVIVTGILGVTALVAFVAILLLHAGDKTVAFAGLSALACLLIPNLLLLRKGTVGSHLLEAAKEEKKALQEQVETLKKALEEEKNFRRPTPRRP